MFSAFGVPDDVWLARAQERLRHRLGRQGLELVWWWVREISKYGDSAPNTHIAAHNPFATDEEFKSLLSACFEPEGGPNDNAIDVKLAYGPYGWWKYCCKGPQSTQADQADAAARRRQPGPSAALCGIVLPYGDLERCTLRPGNVHSADGREGVLKPVVKRYQGKVSRIIFEQMQPSRCPKSTSFWKPSRSNMRSGSRPTKSCKAGSATCSSVRPDDCQMKSGRIG
jgi:hypothetical protein